jgi:T5SS/PEP-CTERM-associated repeat protein
VSQNGEFFIGYSSSGSTGSMRIENGGAILGNNHDGFLAAGTGTTGTVLVDGFDSRWTDIGSLYVGGNALAAAGSATLTVAHGGRIGVNGTLRVWNTGRVELLGSEISAGSFVVEPGGTFQHEDGTLTVNGSSFVPGVSGNYTIDGPSAAEQPTITLSSGASASIPQTLFVGFDHRGQLRLDNGATLNSFNGRVGWSTGTSEGRVTVDGASSRWTNVADLEIGVRNLGHMTISGGGRVENTIGSIAAVAGSYGEVIVSGSSTWANSGSLYVGGKFAPGGTGMLTISNDAEVGSANATVWAPGTIHLDDGILRPGSLNLVGGRLEGEGNVILTGSLTNSGIVAPGNTTGLLSLTNGNYAQTASGILAIDLGGVHTGEFDRLEVHRGNASLTGGLQVSLVDGFLPSVGNVFEVLWVEEVLSGAFDPALISFPALPGRQWNLVQRRGTVRLEILSALLAGDYNGNGVVDAADYVVWRKTDGTQQGYDTWRANFGQTAGSGASLASSRASGAIPEPATLWLMSLAIVWLCARHRSRSVRPMSGV